MSESAKELVTVESAGVITINSNIKSSTHYMPVKSAIEEEVKKGNKDITIKIPESLSITSSVIGVLIKFQSRDDVTIRVRVKDERAYSIFKSLKLIDILDVKLF